MIIGESTVWVCELSGKRSSRGERALVCDLVFKGASSLVVEARS